MHGLWLRLIECVCVLWLEGLAVPSVIRLPFLMKILSSEFLSFGKGSIGYSKWVGWTFYCHCARFLVLFANSSKARVVWNSFDINVQILMWYLVNNEFMTLFYDCPHDFVYVLDFKVSLCHRCAQLRLFIGGKWSVHFLKSAYDVGMLHSGLANNNMIFDQCIVRSLWCVWYDWFIEKPGGFWYLTDTGMQLILFALVLYFSVYVIHG